MRRVRNILFILLLLLAAIVWASNYWVSHSTRKQIYTDINAIPKNKVGLLLGTSKYLSHGMLNPYYEYRLNAAAALFFSGKISYILVSGDNSSEHYNEPEKMKKDLIARGIPPERIYTDYAGFRTLDSILRCKEVFGEDSVTIISQKFHNQRALFIANEKGLHAVAYNADDVKDASELKIYLREKLARVKVVWDIAFNIQPKYYGPKVQIGG